MRPDFAGCLVGLLFIHWRGAGDCGPRVLRGSRLWESEQVRDPDPKAVGSLPEEQQTKRRLVRDLGPVLR